MKKPYPKEYLERVGREAVRVIQARTEKGLDKNGNTFAPYSDDYVKSNNFILAGKSKSHVDLRLFGDMMTALSSKVVDGKVIIGMDNATDRAKAHGHITGAQGRLPVRDFLGVSPAEVGEIMRRLPALPALVAATGQAKAQAQAQAQGQAKGQGQPTAQAQAKAQGQGQAQAQAKATRQPTAGGVDFRLPTNTTNTTRITTKRIRAEQAKSIFMDDIEALLEDLASGVEVR
jgi:hypothetical protein